MGIEKYSTTPGNNASAGSVNFAEGQAPSTVNDSARQFMADVRAWYEDAEWLKLGENGSANAFSISFVSTTVFKFTSTDRRSLVPVGRRVKCGVGAGTIYGVVTDSSLSASDTQITVTFDSGQLDASLSFVSLGVINPVNSSRPIFRDSYAHFADNADPTRRLRIDCGSISTSTIRVLTMPERDVMVGDLTPITATLLADVNLNNTGTYFDGPSVAQGTAGTWFVSGTVTLIDSAGGSIMDAKLWDGTTVIASTRSTMGQASQYHTVALSGFITAPAGNLRISVQDTSSTSGLILANASGDAKDSTITAIRVG